MHLIKLKLSIIYIIEINNNIMYTARIDEAHLVVRNVFVYSLETYHTQFCDMNTTLSFKHNFPIANRFKWAWFVACMLITTTTQKNTNSTHEQNTPPLKK